MLNHTCKFTPESIKGSHTRCKMSRAVDKVPYLLTGVIFMLIFEYCLFPGINIGGGLIGHNSQLDRGKTRVYRYDGRQRVRLKEFCTWTIPVNCAMLKTTSGATPIYIHDLKMDRWLSVSIHNTGSWEPGNVQLILAELQKDQDLGFMDLGSHVGTYSLSVAKFGRNVVSVDPLIENVQRLCKSVQKGGFTDRVTIVFNPLSDGHTMVNFRRAADNVGATNVVTVTPRNGSRPPCEESVDSPTVMLDDLLPLVPFRKAVLKMDVQEHEYKVLKGATKFFQQIHVTAILMEWVMMKMTADGEKLVKLLLGYNFKAYEPRLNSKLLDPKKYKSWPYDVLWRKQ